MFARKSHEAYAKWPQGRPSLRAIFVASAICWAITAMSAPRTSAQDVKDYTEQTFLTWMQKYAHTKPEFKPGDVLTAKDLERSRPFIPPGYLEKLNYPEFKAPIIATRRHDPRADYLACTEKYQAQVRLRPDGTLENYVCGQPFANAALNPVDASSGIKAAWNYEYKWQNEGLAVLELMYIFAFPNGSHDGADLTLRMPPPEWNHGITFESRPQFNTAPFFRGDGSFVRVMQGFHQRVYFNHLPQYESNGYSMPVPDAQAFFYKEFTAFEEPFDIRGTAFIIYRYADPYRADDAWAYIPAIRRVRRISAEVKSDSLLGSDITLEDFYGFSGREMDWNWKFLGWKDVLTVMDPKDDYVHMSGPMGMVTDDVWSVRRVAIVERTPKDPRHPFSAVLNFFDAEDWHCPYNFNFDKKGRLWKILQWQWRYSEDYKDFAEINHGIQAMTWQDVAAFDVQNARGTIASGGGSGYPSSTAQHIHDLYDINRLEQLHR